MKYFYVPSSFSYFCVVRCKHLNKGGNMKYETITKAASLLRDAACSLWSQSYSDWYNANTMQSFEEWSKTVLQLIEQLNNTASELEEEWNEE